jgi:hypothetical protein
LKFLSGAKNYDTQLKLAGAHLFFELFWLIQHVCMYLMYMCDTMHKIESFVIIVCGTATWQHWGSSKEADKQTAKAACKQTSASWHIMHHGACACLVSVNYATMNVFKQLAEKNKT